MNTEWQPIETVPEDDEPVYLWNGKEINRCVWFDKKHPRMNLHGESFKEGWYSEVDGQFYYEDYRLLKPTHWFRVSKPNNKIHFHQN